MPVYDSNGFIPPAPVALVSVRNPGSGEARSNIRMLLDTGADVTLLPITVIRDLRIVETTNESYELIGFEGNTNFSAVVWAEMLFLGYTFRGKFLLLDQDCGVIGRNILNSLSILLDGPRGSWTEPHRR